MIIFKSVLTLVVVCGLIYFLVGIGRGLWTEFRDTGATGLLILIVIIQIFTFCAVVVAYSWFSVITDPILRKLISNEWAMIPALVTAIVFYWLRGRQPFTYGTVEVMVGASTTWAGIHADTTSPIAQALAFFGGLYIIVRGLDNMDKGLPPAIRPWWDKVFPKAKQP